MSDEPPLSPGLAISLLLTFAATCFVVAVGFAFLILRGFQP